MPPLADAMTPGRAHRLAAGLFVHGFPLLLSDAIRRWHPLTSKVFWRIPASAEERLAGLAQTAPAMLQTSAYVDLAEGPMLVRLPPMDERYFVVTMMDEEGRAFASFGSRTLDHRGVTIALTCVDWRGTLPDRIRARRAPGNSAWLLSRILAHSPDDLEEATALAAAQRLIRLPEAAEADFHSDLRSLQDADLATAQEIADQAPELLLRRLAHLIQRSGNSGRGHSALLSRVELLEHHLRHRPETDQAVRRGFLEGLRVITAAEPPTTSGLGWRLFGRPDGRRLSPVTRAAETLGHLGAALTRDVLSFGCSTDETGRLLSGQERYRMRFASDATPPCASGWSLASKRSGHAGLTGTIADDDTLIREPDGDIEILIQAHPPDPHFPCNWLRTPPEPFSLVAHLHWPRAAALEGAWRMPPVERLGSRTRPRAGSARAPRSAWPSSGQDLAAPSSPWGILPHT